MEHVNDANFDHLVKTSDLPVVLDFGATWCGPCKKLEPILEEMSVGYDGKVRFYKVDVGEAPGTAQKFGVMSVPTVVFLREGEQVHRFSGLESKDKIAKLLTQHLGV
jgi:thioredoxin 1